eukprot:Pgem_evm1s7835
MTKPTEMPPFSIYGRYRFHIEYGGKLYLSNHFMDGVVALSLLSAPKKKINEFLEAYPLHTTLSKMLEQPINTNNELITNFEQIKTILGKRKYFLSMCEFYDREIQQRGFQNVIQEYLPYLLYGIFNAAFHPIIHLGYALKTGKDIEKNVSDGLAYLSFVYLPEGPALDLLWESKEENRKKEIWKVAENLRQKLKDLE